MKIIKNFLLKTLALAAFVAVLSFGVCGKTSGEQTSGQPTEGVVYELSEDGTYAIVAEYDGTDTQVRIASSYEGVPVTRVEDCAFLNRNEVTSVSFPENLQEIGDEAFSNCSSLTEIVLPDTVEVIGFGAFKNCSALAEITLPFAGERIDGTENAHFGYIFGAEDHTQNQTCVPTALKKVTLTRATTIAERAFYRCDRLTDVDLPRTLTSIDVAAFYECPELTKIIIPDSVTYVGGYAFAYCYSITIYCERAERDPSWGDRWNYDFPVVWGYTGA